MVSSPSTMLFHQSSSSTGKLRIFSGSGKRLSPPPSSVRFGRALYESAPGCQSHPKMESLYEVLRIPVGATGMEIKAAYRKLARVFHPDVVDRRDSCGEKEFIKIHEAYSTLSDPDKRADYDRRIINIIPGATAAGGYKLYSWQSYDVSPVKSSYSGYSPRRNWDKDQCW